MALPLNGENDMNNNFRFGFIAIVGEPNVGKSTLLNTLMLKKIAIVSNKPQTTRNRIQGILTTDDYQIIFIDSPGIHKSTNELGKSLNRVAMQSTNGVEGILWLVNSYEEISLTHQYIYKSLQEREVPIFLGLTKIDLITSKQLEQKIKLWNERFNVQEIIGISCLKNINISFLLNKLMMTLPLGPQYFPKNMFQDQQEDFFVKEIIREKILLLTHQEVPHGVAILIEEFKKERTKKIIRVIATIIVERDSQKGILIGNGGKMIKNIGSQARIELEEIFATQFYLELFVKVIKKWRDSPNILAKLGYGKK
ncbi:GTPase Era [Spiroplasma endosymbiont of Clivina fossor]|uniref:GTPase Era n=1 Tax=Spiroplasma endosymbiont of Clivina fossor TaxID=3066282 RepID=UPI00313F1519